MEDDLEGPGKFSTKQNSETCYMIYMSMFDLSSEHYVELCRVFCLRISTSCGVTMNAAECELVIRCISESFANSQEKKHAAQSCTETVPYIFLAAVCRHQESL